MIRIRSRACCTALRAGQRASNVRCADRGVRPRTNRWCKHRKSSPGPSYVNPRRNPDFGWAFASRFMFVLAYAS